MAEEYAFIRMNGKIFTEHFIPSTKVSEVKQILKSKTKNVGEFKCLIARGRILDDKDSLSNLYEDDEPINLVNEAPEEIMITVKIKAAKDEIATKVSMIKGATALDVRYYVTQITPIKDLDKIILISEGNELNDDDEFEEDTEIIVNLDKESKVPLSKYRPSIDAAKERGNIKDSRSPKDEDQEIQKLNLSQCQKMIKDLKKQVNLMKSYFSSKEVTNLKEANYIIGEDIEEHHKVLERIGEGATSVAYKIIDEETQKVMCKKILKITKTTTYKDLINGVKEFEVLYSINHPCICQAFGYNPTEPVQDSTEENMTTIAIFLEYLEYSLKECLEKKILNDTLKAKIVVEVAHGMNYIHKLKMIHRDLKIENIMLNPVYEAKIIDFGLARVEEISQDSLTKGVGTFHYMSPEMANQEDYDIKTDVYSFGICIYYIFTGKLPDQSLRDKLNGKPIPLPKSSTTISPFCIELISKCTSPRPDDRPAFIDIIEDMKRHSFMLSSNVDSEIVSHRNLELEIINHINEK